MVAFDFCSQTLQRKGEGRSRNLVMSPWISAFPGGHCWKNLLADGAFPSLSLPFQGLLERDILRIELLCNSRRNQVFLWLSPEPLHQIAMAFFSLPPVPQLTREWRLIRVSMEHSWSSGRQAQEPNSKVRVMSKMDYSTRFHLVSSFWSSHKKGKNRLEYRFIWFSLSYLAGV